MKGEVSSSAASGGVGFLGLLTVVFITLKLIHVVGWSWWWVLAPLWVPSALVILFVIVLAGSLVIAEAKGDNPFR